MFNNLPTDIKLHKKSAMLELTYRDGTNHQLSAEFLRIHSPSAEVRGHGKGQEVLQVGKRQIGIIAIEPVGNYAVKLEFDDGHDSGIYSWPYLHKLGEDRELLWREYLEKLSKSRASRDPLPPETQVIKIQPLPLK